MCFHVIMDNLKQPLLWFVIIHYLEQTHSLYKDLYISLYLSRFLFLSYVYQKMLQVCHPDSPL